MHDGRQDELAPADYNVLKGDRPARRAIQCWVAETSSPPLLVAHFNPIVARKVSNWLDEKPLGQTHHATLLLKTSMANHHGTDY